MRRARFLVLALFAMAALPLGVTFAQYPAPLGACTVTGPASLAPGATAVYTVTALDTSGTPKVGQAFSVTVSPPGAGTVTPSSGVTGANGTATVTVTAGANSANLSVSVTCGPISGGTTIVINPGVTPKPPDTGTGSTAVDGTAFPYLWLAAGIAALSIAGAAGFATVRRRS